MRDRILGDLLRKAPVIIAFHDPDHNILWANAAYCEATGLSLQEIQGRKCFSVWGLSSPCRNCPVPQAIETGERAEAELTPQNQQHWPVDQGSWLSVAAPIHDEQGTVIGAVEVAYDITERKRAEEKARAGEERYRLLAENTLDVIWTMTPDLTFTYVNPAIEQVFGYVPEEFIGSSLSDHCDEEHLAQMAEIVQQEIATGPEGQGVVFETELLHRDGSVIPVEIHGTVIFDDEENPVFLQGVTRDITRRKQAEEGQERLLHDLNERVKELRCLYGVAESVRKRDTMPEVFRDAAELIPSGWHYPEITRGKVTFDGEQYVSEPFEETEWRLAADIVVKGEVRGSIEVFYLEERPELDEGPFMEEERELVQEMARNIGQAVERQETREAIRAANQQLRATEQQLRAANQQLDAYNQQLRAAEETLRRSKRILDATGKMAKIGGWRHDLITGKATWTEALYDIIRIPYGQEPPGVDEYLDYYPPDDRETLRQAYEKAVKEGVPFDLELQVNTAQGDLLWCRVQGEPVYEDGRCVAMRGTFQDITERMEAEEALRRSERKYRAYVENAPEGIFITDKEGAYVDVNETACRMTGYTRQEMLEMTIRELSAQEAIGEVFEDFYRLRKEGALETELLLERKDGTVFHASLKAVALGDERLMGFCSDITERKKAEQRILELNSLLRAIRNVNLAIAEEDAPEDLVGHACSVLQDAPQFLHVWCVTFDGEGKVRYSGSAGIEEPFEELLSRMESGWRPGCVRRALAEPGAPFVLNPTSDCTDCPLVGCKRGHLALKCGFGESTDTRGLLSIRLASGHDVGDEERELMAEVAGDLDHGFRRMEAEEALEASEERYRRLFETAQDGMLIMDADTGRIMDANPFIRDILGYSKEELVGKELWQVGTFRDIAENKERFGHLVQEGYVRYEDLPMETKGGEEVAVEFVSNTYEAGGQQVIQCNIRDISERKRQEAELRTVRQQVMEQERQRALSTMASGIAHDFNNALSTILGFTDLLLESPDALNDRETVRSYLEMVRKAASNAAQTVRRMRKFYRPRDDYALKAVDLNAIAEEAVTMTRPRWRAQALAEGSAIEVEMDFEETGAVTGNEPELHEMLTNLIFNAVDAMPEGGTLSLRTRREDERVLLEVSDTGTGMPEEVRERCLEPFYTTKREAGSGLGLSTVRGIVERHGGTIGVESAPGEGTSFRILLPAYEAAEEGREERDRAPEGGEKLKVLVVEDEDDQRLLITKYLEADGHEVTTAADGAAGVREFLDGWYNVVITDRAMPEMDGVEVARTIRKRAPDKPIIMLTGFGDMMDAGGETLEDVDLVLSKPVTMEELRNAFSAVLERKQSGQSAGDDTGER